LLQFANIYLSGALNAVKMQNLPSIYEILLAEFVVEKFSLSFLKPPAQLSLFNKVIKRSTHDDISAELGFFRLKITEIESYDGILIYS
jgi:hypothetical protein